MKDTFYMPLTAAPFQKNKVYKEVLPKNPELAKYIRCFWGSEIPYVIKDRRPGDIDSCYADASLAREELGWEAQYGIKEMCADSWRWQKNNPNGYED